jgi:riboflavin synthase
MFTGIVEEFATVVRLTQRPNLCVLEVKADKISRGTKAGESIAVNGVCLTATKIRQKTLTFDIMKATILSTTLKELRPKMRVNLERALKAGSRFGGHFVTGHVDGVGVIKKRIVGPNYVELEFFAPKEVLRFIVPKGSVAVDGVSLTVGKVKENFFSVYLIPYTLKVTTLGQKRANDSVNIETDILARYILGQRRKGKR